MKKLELVAYAMDFCSFLLRSEIAKKIDKIILFGSVARGTFDEESDIDLFIDCRKGEKIEKDVRKILKMFELSETNKKWRLKGLKNSISVKIGNLEKWPLRRDIIAGGMLLYGAYKELPRGLKYYLMFNLDFGKMKRATKVKIWRELYGYKQKVGVKKYLTKGLLAELGGKKIEKSVIVVPVEAKDEILNFLRKYRIKHKINELWSDTI